MKKNVFVPVLAKNIPKSILLEQSVNWRLVIFLVIMEEYVKVKLVNAVKKME